MNRTHLGSRALGIVPAVILVGMPGAIVLGLVVFLRRRRPGARNNAFALDQSVERLHRSVLKACSAAGLPRAPTVPLRRHVAQVAQRHPELGAVLVEAADIIYLASFGGRKPSLDRVKALVRELSRSAGLQRL
jgi:hypothetical protein